MFDVRGVHAGKPQRPVQGSTAPDASFSGWDVADVCGIIRAALPLSRTNADSIGLNICVVMCGRVNE